MSTAIAAQTQERPDVTETINERILRQAEDHLTEARHGDERARQEAITYWEQCVAAVEAERAKGATR